MIFELNKKQVEDLEIWREKIRDLHGSVGIERFIFSHNGIGVSCIVENISYGITLDITHAEDW